MSTSRSPAAVSSRGDGLFQQRIAIGDHRLLLDEPVAFGGLDTGPTPYDLLTAALAGCTAMTLAFHARRTGLELPPFEVEVRHERVHAKDCADCIESSPPNVRVDRFERRIRFEGPIDEATAAIVSRIAGKCPVDITLGSQSTVITSLSADEAQDPLHSGS